MNKKKRKRRDSLKTWRKKVKKEKIRYIEFVKVKNIKIKEAGKT